MKIDLRYLFFFLAIGLSNACFGQVLEHDHDHEHSDTTDLFGTDSTDIDEGIVKKEGGSANRGIVFRFYEQPLNVGLPDLHFIDTSKSLFHRYEPYKKNNYFRSDRGNEGLATEDLEYSYHDNILFSYGKSPFELYRYSPYNTAFYQNVNPYAELYYVMGKEREQDFRVFFAQNVWRGLNVGAEYNVINSPGVYSRAYTRHNNVRVFSNFISKNKHYRAVAGYYFNKFESNENGGVVVPADSLFMITQTSNKKLIPTKLQQAENIWKEHRFYFKQSYHFGINRNDTIPNSGINFGYLSHAIDVTRFSTMYSDNALFPENYPAIYRDSLQTFDSTFVSIMRNTFSWNIGDVTSYRNSQFINLSAGVITDLAKVRIDSVYAKNYNYVYPFAKLRLNFRNQYFLSAGATLLSDSRGSDFSANGELYYVFNDSIPNEGVFAEMQYSDVRPRPFQEYYISNSYEWDNSLKNMQTLNFAFGARWKGFQLRGDFSTFFNYTYLSLINPNSDFEFKQSDEVFSVLKVSLEKTFKWRFLAFDTRLVYQLRPTGELMQFPTFSTRSAFYFDFVLLQTTPMQVGFEAYYNTPYLSRFYQPALGSFYGQGNVETGGFAYVDAFLNLRVQRANLFVKLTNAGAGWLGDNYMMTYGYPLLGRAVKFGVLWRFYD